jgi:hypothetical protein
MKRTWMLAALLVTTIVILSPARAAATTVAECQTDIAVLASDTLGALADMQANRPDKADKTEAQLQWHLSKASRELDQLDVFDALKQMGNYSTTVDRAVGSGTLSPDVGAFLKSGADVVIACVKAIGA